MPALLINKSRLDSAFITLSAKSFTDCKLAKSNCVANCTATPGNLGVTFFHQTEGDVTHHTFISYWEDFDAVKRFAGEDFQKARFFPGEERFLVESDEIVEHKQL